MARASRLGTSGARWVRAAACAIVAAGCGDDGGGGGGPTPEGLQILSGSEQVDTIAAELPMPLVVQVFDAPDHPAAGIEVQVGDRTCDLGCRAFSIMRPGAPSQLQTTLETDETGQVTVLLRLGTIPGSALVPISVPSLQLADTARYTVEPGNAASFQSTPDTAIPPGASVTVHAVAQDRLGNPRPETVSYQSRTPSIIEVSSDGQVTARRVGTGVVGLTAGEVTGELTVAVVPPGTISMTNVSTEIGYIQVVSLDGTGRDSLASTGLSAAGASTWSPDGETIIYRSWDGDGGPLRRIPATGGPSTPLPVSGFPIQDAESPQYSSDGTWVYFHGFSSGLPPFISGEIWRVHPDGSGYERVGPAGSSSIADRNPTPSPDGTRVAYVSNRGLLPGFSTLRVLTIAGGAETDLSLEASYPRWSPTGTWIAFTQVDVNLHGTVWLVHPDGSEAHQVSPDSLFIAWGAGLAWSPDGKYLIAVDGVGMMLLDLEGNHVRLPATKGNAFPSWKP
ncbi:MAG TPA: hypothetical protein VG500_10455 [Gemmatimonadales bacterium]|jgi:hypothetical protein|nr:hypothetical protein [Gemmatimonadales bacterium]